MCYEALESTDFRYESIENHPKVLILQCFYGSGTGGREFESRHFDQQKREMRCISLFCWSMLMGERSLQAASEFLVFDLLVRLVAERFPSHGRSCSNLFLRQKKKHCRSSAFSFAERVKRKTTLFGQFGFTSANYQMSWYSILYNALL